ncbi:DUF1127 domain-containing protein [Aestuariicoccus sp. MJ-SS9]|uniref:DUF1127 domain-containing protein n=1 Tax=Aestuariicoccus sp. MJ-SS9 TaxID=3079855 RepID=UPI00290E8313|nr:DUF1127 domain-containing protein [Aestuariicoccus sp. MJ-SS9]MDU8912348.1 DUF1127 domain-containing protein [Aestuariicoccus sp. MJ-SS9]
MTYANTTNTRAGKGFSLRLDALIETFRDRMARRRLYKQTRSELIALSDRELADLGLHRSMLNRIAWQAAYGD